MSVMCKMVIVDDEPRVTQSLEREIRLEFGHDTFSITCFNNATAALPYIQYHSEKIFLVISDLRMPDMNGSDFLAQVRENNPDVQTILLTAYTDIENIQKAVSSSLQSLLFKPWTRESIVAEVDKAYKIWTLRRENKILTKRIDDMLESAGDFQMRLFSRSIPESKSANFDVLFKPYETFHCGGDFYEISVIDENRYLIILGDVTGHGPKPAMIAGMLKTAMQAILRADPLLRTSPDTLLIKLNDHFCGMLATSPETLIALTALYIDTYESKIVIATAGLPAAIHIRDGVPDLLHTPNPMLGAFLDTPYFKTERFLLPGDRLILMTDGLIESPSECFSLPKETLIQKFSNREDYSTKSISEDLRMLLPNQVFVDDVTIVSIQILQEQNT